MNNRILKIVLFIIIGLIVIAFNAQLYVYCKQQRAELNSIKDKQDVEAEFNSNKFKYQEDRIERISKDLEDTKQEIRDQKDALSDQKDALVQEIEKRQEVENESKSVQTSLVDIKAEADAIKLDMKEWQKDYVGVLAELEKKMDNSQDEMKNIENNLTELNIPELKDNINSLKVDIERIAHPSDNTLPGVVPAEPEKKAEHESLGSQ